jgi:hypothetical protein
MFEKNPRMNPPVSRKQLLIAESELNRAQLVQEWQAMTGEARSLANQSRTLRSLASAAAVLINGIASFRCKKESVPAAEKPSWLQTILKGVQLAGSVWLAFRARR